MTKEIHMVYTTNWCFLNQPYDGSQRRCVWVVQYFLVKNHQLMRRHNYLDCQYNYHI